MTFDVTSLVVGILIGVLIATSIGYPRIGRIFARAVAVVFCSFGVGLLVWSSDALIRGNEINSIVWQQVAISEASEALGWGVALVVGGIATLFLSRGSNREGISRR